MRRTGEASDCAYLFSPNVSFPYEKGAGQRGLPKQARPFKGGSLTSRVFWAIYKDDIDFVIL